jgi:excisionase family DNA binding protein
MGTTNKKKQRQQRPVLDERALVTSVEGACILLDEGKDGIYDLVRSGELESYLDGKRRRITMASIRKRVERKVAAGRTFERYRYPNRKPPPDDSPAPT